MNRILVIDDDEAMRSLLRRTLERAGYQVVEASNGRDALRIVPSGHFNLVVTDLLMPEKDGIEVVLHLRRTDPKLPVIAISGGGRVPAGEYLEMAKTLGASEVLAKPFETSVFLKTIERLLAEAAAGA
jgi:CheY-like chemotaxis protein